jgi:catechol 2,3-dioxygenase-like lactoylglutathione lyase family enzyme
MLAELKVAATIPASDLERAKKFYAEKLGLEPAVETLTGIYYRCKDSWFFLYPTPFAGTAQHTLLGWETDDLEGDVERLRSRGVVFEEYNLPDLKTIDGIAEMEGEKAAWFKDSEGNILSISHVDNSPM